MPADRIVLRLARTADAGAMAAMSRDFIEAGLGWRYSADRIVRLIGERDTCAIVAADGHGRVQGFAVMQFGDAHAHLVLLCVRPAQRRRRIGQRLVDWLLASARVAGIESVTLELRADNDTARAFYTRLGFAETTLVPGYYDARIPAQRMVLHLREP
ncbi:MAG: GNAT family N-acetyltransferase [Pseudomonadota bacterium]